MKAQMKKSKIINLLPKEYIQERQAKTIRVIIAGVLVLEAVGFVAGVIIPQKKESQEVLAQLDELTLQLSDERYAEVNQKLVQLDAEKNEVEQWNQKYSGLKEENFVSKRVVDSVLTRVPEGVLVSSLSLSKENTGNHISLAGTSKDSTAVLNYCTLIEGTYGFGKATNEVTYDKEKDIYNYTIEIEVQKEVQQVVSDDIESTEAAEGEE